MRRDRATKAEAASKGVVLGDLHKGREDGVGAPEWLAGDGPDTHLAEVATRLLARWDAHLVERGATDPDIDDVLAFGSLKTLERLQAALAASRREGCEALRLALKAARSARWRADHPVPETPTTPTPRKRPELSVPEAELPRPWRRALTEMRELRAAWDQGLLSLDDRIPPAAKVIRNLASTLRVYAGLCREAGLPVDLEAPSLDRWREARHAAGNKQVTIVSRLKELAILAAWLELDGEVIARLGRLKARHARAARGGLTRKAGWLVENEIDPSHVWDRAEELLALSAAAPACSAARAWLLLDAACLALSVVCPLRSGDLHRVEFGTHLRRHENGWSLTIETDKTGLPYRRPELWPELTPILDALVPMDAPGVNLWEACERRQGTAIFSRDGGVTGVAMGWPSKCWTRHFEIGAHIIRTMWHSWMYESEDDEQYVALALCGQRSARTAEHYTSEGARRRAARRGRRHIREARRRSLERTAGAVGDE